MLGDGSKFRRFQPVKTQQIDLIIGRGDAEIDIETPAISRRHLRIEGSAEAMTVSDLDSSNGTFIRDIPCLAGEIMFIDEDDEIQLGDVRIKIQVLTRDIQAT